MSVSQRLRFSSLFVVLAAVLLASCAAPLGPGFSVKRQSLEIHYLPGDPPRVEIHALYQLKNTGNRDLASIEVGLPGEKVYGRRNLRAALDSGALSTSGATNIDGVLISFGRPWAKKEEHELALEYELTEQSAPYVGIAMAGDSLFLSSTGWFPVLRPAEGLFGKGGDRQNPLDLSVRVPEGYLAHSSGRARGVRKENGELVYRFRIGKDDFDPFVVAGRYFERRFHSADITILFWTLKAPLPQDQFEQAGAHLAATLKAYESSFGLLTKKKEPYRIVGMFGWPTAIVGGFPVVSTPNFPLGAVIPAQEDSALKENDYTHTLAAYGLAQSWFGITPPVESGVSSTFNEVLCHYSMIFVAGEEFGSRFDRRAYMQRALHLPPRRPEQSKEKPLIAMAEGKEPGDKLPALVKGELFLGALEDSCGQDNLRRAMRHMAQSLRGSTYNYTLLLSALEQECHQDLGPMFREWLTETGIPADFRQRYETKP